MGALVLAAHQTTCRLQTDSVASVEVKIEPQPLIQEPQYIVNVPQTQTTPSKPARPVSLALAPRNIEGVTIETPSRQILSFDTLMGAGVMNVNKVKMVSNTHTGGRKRKMVMDEELGDPEEAEKRAMRRDRNRLAA